MRTGRNDEALDGLGEVAECQAQGIDHEDDEELGENVGAHLEKEPDEVAQKCAPYWGGMTEDLVGGVAGPTAFA